MKVLLNPQQLREGVERLANEIRQHYQDEPLTIIGVLTGSVVLLADLIRLLEMPLRVGVVQARSYRGTSTTSGKLSIDANYLPDLTGRQVLVVDDIFDTGNTLSELLIQIKGLNPAAVRSAVLLRKRGRQEVTMQPEFVAFEIPDEFVVGYGLDYDDAYRNLPYLAALESADLEQNHKPV